MKAFAKISPKAIRLFGTKGDTLKKTVTIKPEKEYPFTIKSIKTKNKGNIKFSLEEMKNTYALHVENLKQEPGRYFDELIIKTDSTVKPEIKIIVRGNIKDQISNSNVNPMVPKANKG